MNRRQKIIVSVTGIFMVLIILVGITYAFFVTRIRGNNNPSSIKVETSNLEITYDDGSSSVSFGEIIYPGDDIRKEFVVRNTGNDTGKYSIHLENVVNTFSKFKDVTFVLKRDGVVVKNGTFPSIDKPIMFEESLNAPQDGVCNQENGCLSNYELIVTYEDANYDQSEDMGKTLECLVQIYADIKTIKIEDASDLKALSRAMTYSSLKSTDYKIDTDLSTLGLDLSDKTNEEKIEYLSTANYELTNDISVNFNRSFGDNFFFGIGNSENIFKGNFFGNEHTISLGAGGNITLNALMTTFGLFSYIEDNVITDLKLTLSSNINSTYNLIRTNYGLLSGLAKNVVFENIDFNIKEFDFTFNQVGTYRNSIYMGLLSGQLSSSNLIQNINIDLNNTELGLKTSFIEDENEFYLGLISGFINGNSKKTNINNINVSLNSSSLISTASKLGYVGGIAGAVNYSDLTNISLKLNNSYINVTSEQTGDISSYRALAAGGVIGFAHAGSDNSSGTAGNIGVTLDNVKFISNNDTNIEVISAKEKLGGGVNAGGLVGISFNNAQISNSIVDINNATIIAERSEENSEIATYGAHSGGIIGRMEHTGRINDCEVIGNNLNVIANSTEKEIYAGGIAGIVLGPLHRDLNSLENNKVIGNGTTKIEANVITGNNINRYIRVGALTGYAYYIIKDNMVDGVNISINGLNENTLDAYISNYIGLYNNKPNHIDSSEYFTPRTSEIINPIINNVNVNTNGLDSYVTVTNY